MNSRARKYPSSARGHCTAYTRLYIHWWRITVLLSMLNDDFSTWRLFTVDDWQLCTRLFHWQLCTTFLLVDDFPTVDNSIHDSRRLATLDDSFTMDNFKRLPTHMHNTAYIVYATTTRAFDCPLNSSSYKRRTQLAILNLSPATCNSWSTWKRKQSNRRYPGHMLYQPIINRWSLHRPAGCLPWCSFSVLLQSLELLLLMVVVDIILHPLSYYFADIRILDALYMCPALFICHSFSLSWWVCAVSLFGFGSLSLPTVSTAAFMISLFSASRSPSDNAPIALNVYTSSAQLALTSWRALDGLTSSFMKWGCTPSSFV